MAKAQYVGTDKNGTKIYHDYTCERCGGLGARDEWLHTGKTCFDCGGSGIRSTPRIIKEYTPEYAAKLEERRAKRHEQERAKRLEQAAPRREAWLNREGFGPDGMAYVVKGDTYAIREELKAAGAKFNRLLGWHFSTKPEAYETAAVHVDEVTTIVYDGIYEWNYFEAIRELVGPRIEIAKPESQHVGTVGEKITVDVKLEAAIDISTRFGSSTLYKLVDEAGNVYTWLTKSWLGEADNEDRPFDAGTIKATIKAHTEYNGIKQTEITRVKAI